MRTGLVLEGGAMRGMYTAGVLDVFMENYIEVEGVIGVSAGAVFGCNYKSGQIGRTIRYNKKYCKDPRFGNIRSWLKSGDIYEEEFCYREIPGSLDPFDTKAFQENPVEFYVTCTDVYTGKPVYHRCDIGDETDVRWMQASASMPLVSKVVSIGNYRLLDGGISDSIPVKWFMEQGFEKNVVILTQPEGYRKEKNKLLPLLRRMMKKYPAVIESMRIRHEVYNATLDLLPELEKTGAAYVIRPSRRIKVSKTENNPDKLQALYDLGREDAEKQLNAVRDFLQSKHKC